jgi:hypothetical protein
MNKLSCKFNAKLILAGDFNNMPLHDFTGQFDLKPCVDFHTRGNATLDQILTDIPAYGTAIKLPPLIGNENDHCGILLQSATMDRHSFTKTKKRVVTNSSKHSVMLSIAKQDWRAVTVAENLDDKVEHLHNIATGILDQHCPIRTVKVREDKPNFISPILQKLIKARDRAFRSNSKSWKFLSKLTKKMLRKRKVEHVQSTLNRATSSKCWWRELKSMEGKSQRANRNSFHLLEEQWMPTEQLADKLNRHFAMVGGSRQPLDTHLDPSHSLDHVSIGQVKSILKAIDTRKANTSEDFPSWVTKLCHEDICEPFDRHTKLHA